MAFTDLASGSAVSFTITAGGTVRTTSSGGSMTADVSSVQGESQRFYGPQTFRKTFGPYNSDATVTLTCTGGTISYDATSPLMATPAQAAAFPALVSEYGVAYTWATVPSAPGNAGKIIRVTDVGHTAGGSYWYSDGTYWRPVGGVCTIAQQAGGPFNPLTQNTGATTHVMTIPQQPIIPANMLIPGQSQIEFEAWIRRVGANGTATLQLTLGINNAPSTDLVICNVTMAATDSADTAPCPLVTVVNATKLSSTSWLARYGATVAATGVDSSAGMVNIASPMYANIRVTSANAADTFRLVAYRFTIRQ